MHEVQRLISTGLRDIHNWIKYERIIYARVVPRLSTKCWQLFQERLPGKVLATIPKGIVGSFEFIVPSKKFERMAREAMDVCLRVLKESNKSRFDGYSVRNSVAIFFPLEPKNQKSKNKINNAWSQVRNSVLIISHVTFWYCRVHIFSKYLYTEGLEHLRRRQQPLLTMSTPWLDTTTSGIILTS